MSLFSNNKFMVLENSNSQKSELFGVESMSSGHASDAETYSFTNESFDFVVEYTREYNTVLKEFYKNILESNDNQEIINESFSDFFSKVKAVIKKFIEFIKKIFAKFVTKMHSLFKSEKYLERNKDKFSQFDSSDEFIYKGYNFTKMLDDCPTSKPVSSWFADGGANASVTDLTGDDPLGAVTSKYEKFIDGLDDFYDSFRGLVLGVNYDITSSDFDKECREIFRDGDSDPIDITIDSTKVMECYTQFHNYHDLIKSIEKTKNDLEKDYDSLAKAFEKGLKKEKDGDGWFFTWDPSVTRTNVAVDAAGFGSEKIDSSKKQQIKNDVYNKIDMYMKAKVTQIHNMSSIHTLAFSAKLQAARDCFVQNKSILYKALAKIQGHKKTAV